VASRVISGGHHVPEMVIRRRWAAGLRALFDLYLPLVDNWVVFDNSDRELRRVAVGGHEGRARRLIDEERWARILTLAVLAGASANWSGGEFFDPVAPIHDDGQSQP
jgi:predicted ABC-type ATPase